MMEGMAPNRWKMKMDSRNERRESEDRWNTSVPLSSSASVSASVADAQKSLKNFRDLIVF